MFELKRFMAFIAAGLLLVAAKYYPVEIATGAYGKVEYFNSSDEPVDVGSAYSFIRADCDGGEDAAKEIINSLKARIVFVERPDGETIYYCHSFKFPKSVKLKGRKINLAVAVRGDSVAIGSPLLKGCY